jgi:hypothetical protein
MSHTRGKPYHPMTQGKIERWHLSLKSRILLDNYYLPGDLERAVAAFVEHYNHRRYHESLDNLTPADVYFGRGQTILNTRRRSNARLSTRAANFTSQQQLEPNEMIQTLPLVQWQSCPKCSEDGQSRTAPIGSPRISR